MSTAISLQGLSRSFGPTDAVTGLTFEVGQGELFGLVGPDGAGKTTTLRMLAGVVRPTSGDALVDGVSVVRDPEGVKHAIAYMSQRFGLYMDLTVRENIEFYADLYRVPKTERRQRLERLYQFSNLGPFEDRLAGQLSGGMKQKLSLSCALIHRPQIMLLDEPTFGVDPISRRDLWLILHQMVADGVTVFVSTSYLDEAERCDRVAMLNYGDVIALDTPAAIQGQLAGRILAVRTDAPRPARDLLRRAPSVRQAALFGDSLHVVLDHVELEWPPLEEQLRQAGIGVLGTSPVPPSLEDAFIHLVSETPAAV